MDDLERFLEFLYSESEGYVYVATKDTLATNQEWLQSFFLWPEAKLDIYNYITRQQEERDVYVAPALFKGKNSLKKSVQGTNVAWVEFDGQQQIDFQDLPYPDCIVQTSVDTHLHCYWRIDYLDNTDTIDNLNRRLTHYLEADASGFDANQVLRPPLSKNWKHAGLPVTLKHLEDTDVHHSFASFEVAPEPAIQVIRLRQDMLLPVGTLLKELPLHALLKKKIMSEMVVHPHRSSFLMKVAHELAEEGCNHIQIVSLLDFVDDRIKKFEGRRDKLTRLSELASVALLHVSVEEGLQLYSPLDILNHKETLEWIIPNWLHKSGFVILTGAPSVGKTTLALQLMKHLANAETIFSKEILRETKILFLSLEMTQYELKYFLVSMNKEFQNDPKWIEKVRILDEDRPLLDYETIIAEYGPDVVFIDSLTELATEELKETEARAITRWIRKLRKRYKCAFVVIHHNRKESGLKFKETKLAGVYGSFIFGKDAETILNLDRDEVSGDIALYSLKARFDRKFTIDLTQNENLIFNEKGGESDSQQSRATGPNAVNIALQ